MFESRPDVEAEISRLSEWFGALPDGETVTWLRIEQETSISMKANGRGRARVRRALRRLKRPWEALPGIGVRLSSPDTAMSIVSGRFCRIDGAVRIADRVQKELQVRHLEKMRGEDQQRMLIAAGFFGAIRAYAKQASVKILK